MFTVVGCRECGALWIVAGRPDTTGCPRCRTRHEFDQLRPLAKTDDEVAARHARAAILARRQAAGESAPDPRSFAELASDLDDVGVGDEAYLEGMGIDPDALEAVGERGTGRDRRATVRAALRELDEPTEQEVVDYGTAHGVPADIVREALEQLCTAGAVTRDAGRYRLL